MINAFAALQNYNDNNWEEHLNNIGLYEVFKEIIHLYSDTDDRKCIIKYIIWTYSVESDRIVIGRDWLDNKKEIFEAANVKPTQSLYNDLVLLKNDQILAVIIKWMNFQDSDTFKQLSVLKDLRVEMQTSSISSILKATGEQDFDQKFKNAKYAIELKSMIRDLEAELVQNNVSLKEAIKEVKVINKRKDTFGVENFSR